MNFTTFYHVGDERGLIVSCDRQHPGVPVLRVGDVCIFPRRDQLERIRDVISDYLCNYPAESDPEPVAITEDVAF